MVFYALFGAALFDSKTPRRSASDFNRKMQFHIQGSVFKVVPTTLSLQSDSLDLEHCGRGEQIMPPPACPPQPVLTTERLKLSFFSK